jgi:hypothetical protein
VARHIFQACPVWIYIQSNITQASYSPEYITPTQQISSSILLMISCMHEAYSGILTRPNSPYLAIEIDGI